MIVDKDWLPVAIIVPSFFELGEATCEQEH
jgi:hypothetical protein